MNARTILIRVLTFGCLIALTIGVAFAGKPVIVKDSPARIDKVTTNDFYRPILVNSVFNYFSNTGDGSFNPFSADNEGFEYPKGSSGFIIFEDGVVWGGYQNGVKKVGGSTYNHGLQAGRIISVGNPDNPGSASNRMYSVRPDIFPTTDAAKKQEMINKLATEEVPLTSRYESYSADQLYNFYVADWNEWPAADGAPYKDVDNNGVYDPTIDIPGVPGSDQTLYYVANDLNVTATQHLYGSNPIGIEQHKTIWAYNQQGPLGSTLFESTKLINKSGGSIDSMYIAQWSDPDLGGSLGYRDDFVGCDTTRSLGYVYNGGANDGFFGKNPPAGGYVFFQGPIIPTGNPADSAVFDLKYRHGYKNLKMTAFNFFINGSTTYADPRLQDPRGTDEWYNLMKGLVGRTGAPYINPVTNQPDKFLLSGDPVAGTGWLDGIIAPPDDRRMALITGPFTMHDGDTQEVVVANLAAQIQPNGDRLSNVSLLKYYTDVAQQAYNNLFVLPSPPPPPKVRVTELDGEILLDWNDSTAIAATENQNDKGYKFEGYNVYQLKGPSFSNPQRLATFDIVNGVGKIRDFVFDPTVGDVIYKPVQFGNDFGIQRYFDTKSDFYGSYGLNLVNGQQYYFAVTAYNYNPTLGLKNNNLESAPVVFTVTPHSSNPGNTVRSSNGQLITDWVQTGLSDGSIVVRVVDPSKVTGHQYQVTFDDTSSSQKKWYVTDATLGKTVLYHQTRYVDDAANPVVDGLQFGVLDPGASGGFKEALLIKNGSTDLSSDPPNIMRTTDPTDTWGMDVLSSTSRASAFARLGASLEGAVDYEIRIVDTTQGSQYYPVPGLTLSPGDTRAPNRLPATFWEITTNPPKQLIPGVRDADGDGLYTPDLAEAPVSAALGGTGWDAFYVQDPASTGYYAEPLPNPATATSAGFAFRRLFFVDPNNTSATVFPVPAGTVIRLITNKPITHLNSFTLNTGNFLATYGDQQKAANDVEKINVFPNPYFGFNKAEINKYNRFVTINHLPTKATIRIFTLAGVLVRTLQKDDPNTQFMQWDLSNVAGIPAAAGMYIIHVDMPELGKTKILKLAIIPETQYLDRL